MDLLPHTPLARLSRQQLPAHMQQAWDAALALHGDTTFIEVFGQAPQAYDWYLHEFYRKFFYSGRIERSVVELVRLRLANIHGCAFCNRSDTLAALAGGVPQAQIDSLQAAGAWTLVAGETVRPLRIRRVSPVVEAAGQARDVVLAAAAGDAPLAPGLAGELRWRSTVPHLPPAYLQQIDGRLGAGVVRAGEPVFVALPHAQAGRPVAGDWPLQTAVVDQGRFALGLRAGQTSGAGVNGQ